MGGYRSHDCMLVCVTSCIDGLKVGFDDINFDEAGLLLRLEWSPLFGYSPRTKV